MTLKLNRTMVLFILKRFLLATSVRRRHRFTIDRTITYSRLFRTVLLFRHRRLFLPRWFINLRFTRTPLRVRFPVLLLIRVFLMERRPLVVQLLTRLLHLRCRLMRPLVFRTQKVLFLRLKLSRMLRSVLLRRLHIFSLLVRHLIGCRITHLFQLKLLLIRPKTSRRRRLPRRSRQARSLRRRLVR